MLSFRQPLQIGNDAAAGGQGVGDIGRVTGDRDIGSRRQTAQLEGIGIVAGGNRNVVQRGGITER